MPASTVWLKASARGNKARRLSLEALSSYFAASILPQPLPAGNLPYLNTSGVTVVVSCWP